MTNSETKNFSQNVSSSYHLEDRGKCNKNTCANARNVPKLRFKGYNDEWVEHKLDEKGVFLKGSPISKNDISQYGKPCILYGELYTKYDEVATKIFSVTDTQDKNLVTSKINDVLIPSSGETAIDISTATCILNDDVILGGDLNIYRTKDCDGRFISYSINHKNRRKIAKLAQGATIFHLYPNFLKKFKILLPSLHEQEKIASFLTLIDKKIEKQKELVELLKKYKRGLLSAIFSQKLRFKDDNGNDYPAWEEKSLNNIFDTVTDFVAAGSFADLRKNVQYNEKPDFAQLVRTIDLKNNFKNKDFVFVNELAFKYLWRVNLSEDALILPNIGANIGEVYYINSFKLPYKHNVLGPNAILLKSSNNNLYYLYSRCLTDNFRKLLFLQVGASGQPKFNKTDLKKIKIKISINIDEQDKISDFLSTFDDKIQQEECKLNNLQIYKQGLLQQMFI